MIIFFDCLTVARLVLVNYEICVVYNFSSRVQHSGGDDVYMCNIWILIRAEKQQNLHLLQNKQSIDDFIK